MTCVRSDSHTPGPRVVRRQGALVANSDNGDAGARASGGDATDSLSSDQAPAHQEATTSLRVGWLYKLFDKLKRFKGVIVAIAGVGAVLSGLVGYWTAYKSVAVGAPPPTTAVASTTAGPLSIFVMPFANQTGDPQKAYVADALTSSITADLARVRDAFVIGSATAFAYKDKAVTLQQLGKDVGVRFVLQGSVLSKGEKIRISAQLADTQSGGQLWTETFDGELGDLFALQDQVTARIALTIGREMVIVAARDSEMRKSSPKVADLLLRVRALNWKPANLKNHEQVEAWSRQALALEPDNASAMVLLANALVYQASNFGAGMDKVLKEQKYVQARELAMRAKELDPGNPGLYVALGFYARAHDDHAGARRAADTRLALDPRNPSALNIVAWYFLNDGAPEKARELLTLAYRMSPTTAEYILRNLGRAHFMLGDNDAAIDWLSRYLEKNPANTDPQAHAFLAMAYALKGDDTRARTAVAELRRIAPNYKISDLDQPSPMDTAAYKEFVRDKLLPAAHKAGLPE